MKKLGLTEEELAELLGISERTLANYISGDQTRPQKYQTALRMCVVFRLTASQAIDFLFNIGYPKSLVNRNDPDQVLAYSYVLINPRKYPSVDALNKVLTALGGSGI